MAESNVFIPMGDGVRLAATLYLPGTAGPWPALLEARRVELVDRQPQPAAACVLAQRRNEVDRPPPYTCIFETSRA